MGLLKNPQLLIIKLICWLVWTSSFSLAQYDMSEGITGFVNFPSSLQITCLGNLAVCVTSLIRGRLDLEIAARDVLEILLSPKLSNIDGIKHENGLTTCKEDGQTASTERVGLQRMGKFFKGLRDRLGINLPCLLTTIEDPQNVAEEGRVQIANSTEEGGLQAVSGGEIHLQRASTEEGDLQNDAQEARVQTAEGESLQAASAEGEGHLQRASTEEGYIHNLVEEGRLQTASTEGGIQDASAEGEGHLQRASTEEEYIQNATEEGRLQTASTEGALQAASAEGESHLERASIEGIQIASTEENLYTTSTKLRTASVVLLSNDSSNSSIREFMKSNAAIVDSILLRFLPLEDAIKDASQRDPPEFTIVTCECSSCDCIIFWTVEEITGMLGRRMPRTLKVLSNSRCLLPCHTCLLNHCHGCDEASMLRVPSSRSVEQAEEGNGLTSDPEMVPKVLNSIHTRSINTEQHICICIPVHDASSDVWTELLLRSLRSKDAESRGVRVKATEAMESYLAGRRGGAKESEESDYNIVSFIMPRLTEVVINVVLTFWFRIDGFSSCLVARRIVRNYMVDSKGSGFAANSFLTKAVVILNSNNTQVCQVLAFRGNFLGIKRLSFMVGFVNLICSLGWVFLIGYKADISPSLSYQSYTTAIFCITMALVMDIVIIISGNNKWTKWCLVIVAGFLLVGLRVNIMMFGVALGTLLSLWSSVNRKERCLFTVMTVEAVWLGSMGIFITPGTDGAIWRWALYGGLQTLVWVKWAIGSYILAENNSKEFFGKSPHMWGVLLYSSGFLLNAVLAGVRCDWGAWPWKYILSEKLLLV